MADFNHRPRVSVIIVVRNGEAFLREAIESVRNQTLPDWELLVVDDGSVDGTADIVRKYVSSCPESIFLLTHPDRENHGISASRNLGLTHARGAFIAFLDADDVWLPEKLAEQVTVLEADDSLGLVYGRTLIWHSWNERAAQADYYYPLGVTPEVRHEPPILFELMLENKSQTPTTCNAMMRADLFHTVGGFEDRFHGMFEDQTFFAKALATAPAYVAGRTWARYRQHPASCTAVSAARGRDEIARFVFLKWLSRSMASRQPSKRLQAAIRRAQIDAATVIAKGTLQRLRAMLR